MINFKHIQNGSFNINGRTQTNEYTQAIKRLDSVRENLDKQIHTAVLKVAIQTAKGLGIDIIGLSDFAKRKVWLVTYK